MVRRNIVFLDFGRMSTSRGHFLSMTNWVVSESLLGLWIIDIYPLYSRDIRAFGRFSPRLAYANMNPAGWQQL